MSSEDLVDRWGQELYERWQKIRNEAGWNGGCRLTWSQLRGTREQWMWRVMAARSFGLPEPPLPKD